MPRKNCRNFCGRPMVAWPTRAACQSGLFDYVIISTDDDEIAAAAMGEGAERPFTRPAHLADAYSTTSDVLKHDLEKIREMQGHMPKYCCCLYGTSAFVNPAMLENARNILQNDGTELVMGVIKYPHVIERALIRDSQGDFIYRHPENCMTRTQDFTPSFYDSGLFYFFDTAAFQHNKYSLFPLKRNAIELSIWDAADIDDEEDWIWAEQLAKIKGLNASR